MRPNYNDYLRAQLRLIHLYGIKHFIISEAESIMSSDYEVSDEMYLDDIYCEELPKIYEEIDALDLCYRDFRTSFKNQIYEEYIKRQNASGKS